jgi:hypothetical protein
VLSRFGIRIVILISFAALGGVAFGTSLAALSAMSSVLCAIVAVARREQVFPRTLNHWDEAIAYGALHFLTVGLGLPKRRLHLDGLECRAWPLPYDLFLLPAGQLASRARSSQSSGAAGGVAFKGGPAGPEGGTWQARPDPSRSTATTRRAGPRRIARHRGCNDSCYRAGFSRGQLKIPLVAEHEGTLRKFGNVLLGREKLAVILPEHQLALQAAKFCAYDRPMQRPEGVANPFEDRPEWKARLAGEAAGVVMVQVKQGHRSTFKVLAQSAGSLENARK